MKNAMTIYRLGALTLLFTGGVFFEEPLKSLLVQDHSALSSMLLLYGFPVLAGFSLLVLTGGALQSGEKRILLFCNALSALSIFWLLLWAILSWNTPNSSTGWFYLLGAGLALTGYCVGWKKILPLERAVWFLMAAGGSISCTGWI